MFRGSPALGTAKARPERKMSSWRFDGNVVSQVFVAVENDVVADVAVGEKVIAMRWARANRKSGRCQP